MPREIPTPEDLHAAVELQMGLIEDRVTRLEETTSEVRGKLRALLARLSEWLDDAIKFLYGVLVGVLIAGSILL